MNGGIWFLIIVVVIVIGVVAYKVNDNKKLQEMPPEQRKQELARREAVRQERVHGERNAVLVCPHCQTKGLVRTKGITQKKGISGGKATGALLTGGVSLLATGLSRKEHNTQAHCDHCGSTWTF